MEGVSEKLKVAMEEIKRILERHDIAGVIQLADGEKGGEFLLGIVHMSWSMFSFKRDYIHLKAHMGTNKEMTEKSINALFSLIQTTDHNMVNLQNVAESLQKSMKVEQNGNTPIMHGEYLKNKGKPKDTI